MYVVCFFFFKQKTAYEMRISDWSSDVCSSDLRKRCGHHYSARRLLSERPDPINGGREGGIQVGVQRRHLHARRIQAGCFVDAHEAVWECGHTWRQGYLNRNEQLSPKGRCARGHPVSSLLQISLVERLGVRRRLLLLERTRRKSRELPKEEFGHFKR